VMVGENDMLPNLDDQIPVRSKTAPPNLSFYGGLHNQIRVEPET
jgi:hypothetical protein